METKTVITKDVANKKLHVTREFAAPVEKIWKAWTDSAVLDKWWGPKPWRAETMSMDFSDGGLWLYAMVGPEGEKHYSRVDVEKVVDGKSFSTLCSFCDENGNVNPEISPMRWFVEFFPSDAGTRVEVQLTFTTDEGMQKIIAMGFEGGFSIGLNQLDELIAE